MFIQTLAIAAAAATAAPAVLAQTAGAPTAASNMFASCEEKLGANGTHSLLDIYENALPDIANAGEESVLAPILEEVTPETMEILAGFDVTGDVSYTFMMPLNQDGMGELLTDKFVLNGTAVLDKADDIILAHIIPETLDFVSIQEGTNATGMMTVESMQGFEWTFGWNAQGDEGGYPYLVDEWSVTTTGEIDLVIDIRVEPDCPNRIIGIRGFVVTPELLADAPAPAISPRAVTPSVDETPAAPVDPTTPADTTPTAEEPAPSDSGTYPTSGLAVFSAVGAAALGAALL